MYYTKIVVISLMTYVMLTFRMPLICLPATNGGHTIILILFFPAVRNPEVEQKQNKEEKKIAEFYFVLHTKISS